MPLESTAPSRANRTALQPFTRPGDAIPCAAQKSSPGKTPAASAASQAKSRADIARFRARVDTALTEVHAQKTYWGVVVADEEFAVVANGEAPQGEAVEATDAAKVQDGPGAAFVTGSSKNFRREAAGDLG